MSSHSNDLITAAERTENVSLPTLVSLIDVDVLIGAPVSDERGGHLGEVVKVIMPSYDAGQRQHNAANPISHVVVASARGPIYLPWRALRIEMISTDQRARCLRIRHQPRRRR